MESRKMVGAISARIDNIDLFGIHFKQLRPKTAQFKTPARGRPSETFRNLPKPFETFQNLRLRRVAQSSDFTSVQFALL